MANSVVKVTDSMLNDSLLLLVGEDGTVTPDKETVESYLNAQTGDTNIQLMHINKSDGESIDVVVENVVYSHDADEAALEDLLPAKRKMDQVARILYNIKLDHDYTAMVEPVEEDELAKTLSILDGGGADEEIHLPKAHHSEKHVKDVIATKSTKIISKQQPPPKTTPANNKRIKTRSKSTVSKYEQDDDYKGEEDSDENDSDFEVLRSSKRQRMSYSKQQQQQLQQESKENKIKSPKTPTPKLVKVEPALKIDKSPSSTPTTPTSNNQPVPQSPEVKSPTEKKALKKDKKPTKPIPDDFALFSTPDIIRRVSGGKEQDQIDGSASPTKPAKIENRSRSASESQNVQKSSNHRLSLDGKSAVIPNKAGEQKRLSVDGKSKRNSIDSVKKSDVLSPPATTAHSATTSATFPANSSGAELASFVDSNQMPSIDSASSTTNDQNMSLDGTGLDLDPSLLDNINNDLISDDILYQVAQSLVSNPELQNAIDKSLNEDGNLVLDPANMPNDLLAEPSIVQNQQILNESLQTPSTTTTPTLLSNQQTPKSGTQIVRPDGRIVVIPPIERPTTRSRNKTRESGASTRNSEKPATPKFTHKPLDDEHVSGNELDSSDEGEEESEDDPNKLWCICNQPHNNRFMICCDTCEEWYHGKCVNITKAMGQQMESEGKEWICLFCKDPHLKRPQAAARRIRRASRTSRQSTDSAKSEQHHGPAATTTQSGSVPCIVCQKPSRSNSIYCSENCILAHAQGVERVVVFERATGNMLTGNKAPSAANLEQWLRDHPGYEVVRSAGKVVTTKATNNVHQSKLKLVKNADDDGVSLAVRSKKGVNVGVLKHAARKLQGDQKPMGVKIISAKQGGLQQQQQQKTKTPVKSMQSTIKAKITSNSTPTKPTTSTSSTSGGSASKEKSIPVKTPKSRQAESSSSTPPTPKQENIRDTVQKTIFEQLTNRLKMVEDLKLTESELKSISTEIESQLYKCFGDTGQKYRNKYRSLMFNIKDVKNQTLWRRICEKSINPYQLVRLSSDDMASQELALWREREAKHQLDMIKKSELELLNCNRQYVLKTHKGEQVLEDNRPNDTIIDNTEVITSLTDDSMGDSTTSSKKDGEKKTSSITTNNNNSSSSSSSSTKQSKEKKDHHRSSSKEHHRHRSSSKDDRVSSNRKRSKSRDKKETTRKRSRSRGRDRHRRSSHKSSRHKKESRRSRSRSSTNRTSSTEKLDKKTKEILEQLVDKNIVRPLEDQSWKQIEEEQLQQQQQLQEKDVAKEKQSNESKLEKTAATTVPPESDSDNEPTSTVTIPTPPRSTDFDDGGEVGKNKKVEKVDEKVQSKKVPSIDKTSDVTKALSPQLTSSSTKATKTQEIWRGIINMIDVAQISISAHEVSGDCTGLGTDLPPILDIVGRISPETVWDYIGKMRCSNSKIISLVRLNAVNEEEKMPYLALYSYLSSRNRLGVVKSTSKSVKDYYIWPLAAQKPIPQALLPISGPGFEESRPALLLGIIVRDKRKRGSTTTTTEGGSSSKKIKVEVGIVPRSYTPPPTKDLIRSKLPLPPTVTAETDDADEPYSPEDSDPENSAPALIAPAASASTSSSSFLDASSTPFQPFANKFDDIIPGLETPTLPSTTQEIQRQMEKLNKEIEMQKSEINSISQNIVTAAASTEIGTSALASIALPSNLQQILDSIKTIGAVSTPEITADISNKSIPSNDPTQTSTDLTIPLMLPTTFSRSTTNSSASASDTIPLNLPSSSTLSSSKKNKDDAGAGGSSSVLSSLSEEDLIRKAEEMLEESNVVESSNSNNNKVQNQFSYIPGSKGGGVAAAANVSDQPPIPGLEDEPFDS